MTETEAWWAAGVSLAERAAHRTPAASPLAVPPGGRPGQLLDAWRHDHPTAQEFRARLAEWALDEDRLAALLAEPPELLAARVAKPSWAVAVEEILARTPACPSSPAAGIGWREGFALVLAPFGAYAADRLLDGARQAGVEAAADPAAVRRDVIASIETTLVTLARRTLVLELHTARAAGRLHGDSPEQRFADFVRLTASRSGLRGLLSAYPVLARLLAQACEHAVEAWTEMLARLAADRTALVDTLFAGTDPGRLTGVRTGAGDCHQRGRSVTVLRFDDGRRVVFKPRSVSVHGHFNDAVHWLGSHLAGPRPRTLRVLERPGYGWVEYASSAPCPDREHVARFYRRLGVLLALFQALGATDLHAENLIACADQPLAVDVETLFQPLPACSATDDPARSALQSSVHRTALLPSPLVGDHGALDVSALGGERGAPLPDEVTGWSAPGTDEMRLVRTTGVFQGAANRPRLGGADTDPGSHTEDILAGFREGYDAITAHSGELLGPDGLLARFAADDTRIVLRNTRWYVSLLDESTHPDVLRDAADRDRLLDLVWRESVADPVLGPLANAELTSLWEGDVPLVGYRPAGRDLTVGRTTAYGLVTESGLTQAERRIAAMCPADRAHQEWVIRADLATRRTAVLPDPQAPPAATLHEGVTSHRSTAAQCGPVAAARGAAGLRAAARAVADRIMATAQDNGRRVNWLGLEPLDARVWALMPQGAGLAHGHCGTALFLAQLAQLTGAAPYARVARRALTAVPDLLDALAERPADLVTVGTGFAGLGGIAYALGRLAVLLEDPDVADWADAAALLAAGVGPGTDADVREGTAGLLAAMLAVWTDTGSARAAATARDCADRLAALPAGELPVGGFDTGAAGVGWALMRFAAAGGGDRYAASGLAALRVAADRCGAVPFGTGWCDGPSGTALAIADSPEATRVPTLAALLDGAVAAAATASPSDHSLCHGQVGALDLSVTAAASARAEPGAVLARAEALTATFGRLGPRCATPDAVSSPGLLTGLAGIGFGLLRAGFAGRVPSVLLLRPPGRDRPVGRRQTVQTPTHHHLQGGIR
jgi:class II lanthipeptide synthase